MRYLNKSKYFLGLQYIKYNDFFVCVCHQAFKSFTYQVARGSLNNALVKLIRYYVSFCCADAQNLGLRLNNLCTFYIFSFMGTGLESKFTPVV